MSIEFREADNRIVSDDLNCSIRKDGLVVYISSSLKYGELETILAKMKELQSEVKK